MSQPRGGGHPARSFPLRTIALIVGLVGAALALVINTLYSLLHVLARVMGLPSDSTHFFYGLLVAILGAAGAFLAPSLPGVAAVLLIVAAIAPFFIVGWWALLVAPFFLVAALLASSNRSVDIPGTA